MERSQVTRAVVVSFNDQRSFGVVRSRALRKDVFVHVSVVEAGRPLRPGHSGCG